jgi:hypothetical protein
VLVARLTSQMQIDLQIDRELDRVSEIVKMKSAWRGIKILHRSDPSGVLQMTKPVPPFQTFQSEYRSSNRLKKQSVDFRNSGIPKRSMLVGSHCSCQSGFDRRSIANLWRGCIANPFRLTADIVFESVIQNLS